MMSSSSHMSAAGLDHSDSNYSVVEQNSAAFTFYTNTYIGTATPSDKTVQIGTASASRYVLIGFTVWNVTAQGQTVSSVTLGGISADTEQATTQNYNTGTQSLATYVGAFRVPTGTTVDIEMTLGISGNGFLNYWVGTFDIGAIPAGFTVGNTQSPNGSGTLSIADMGNKSGALIICAYEDDTDDSTTITFDPDPDSLGLTRSIDEESSEANSTKFLASGALVNGNPSNAFPIEASVNNYDAGDIGILQYITAHYY